MSRRIAQRDLNVARKMLDDGQMLIAVATGLLMPDQELDINWQKKVSDELLDLHHTLHEHGRKINVVEKKGQRA